MPIVLIYERTTANRSPHIQASERSKEILFSKNGIYDLKNVGGPGDEIQFRTSNKTVELTNILDYMDEHAQLISTHFDKSTLANVFVFRTPSIPSFTRSEWDPQAR